MRGRPIQEPVERVETRLGRGESRRFEHPAFGQITASRVSGSTALYDSEFGHQHYVALRIHRSELHRDLSHDRHFAGKEIIEVFLSEAQWASFISSMNLGSGVPCTLSRVLGETMPALPIRVQKDEFQRELRQQATDAVGRVDSAIAEVEGVLGSSLSGKKREQLLSILRRLKTDIGSDLPFVLDSFEEHMETVVERAKSEVNAYVQAMVTQHGLQALAGGSESLLSLGAGSEETDTEKKEGAA